MPMGRSETNTASAVAVLMILALRVRPLSKTSAIAPRRNAGTPTAAAITMRTLLSPPEPSRFTQMTTTLVATASEDRAAPARTPPSRRDRGLRRWGAIMPVNPRARAEPALTAPQEQPPKSKREYDYPGYTACLLPDRAAAAEGGETGNSQPSTGWRPSIPPRTTVFYQMSFPATKARLSKMIIS